MAGSRHTRAYERFLERLRAARLAAGLTQVEAARRLGESQKFVSNSEIGERRVDVVELQRFAEVYGVALAELLPPLPRGRKRRRS